MIPAPSRTKDSLTIDPKRRMQNVRSVVRSLLPSPVACTDFPRPLPPMFATRLLLAS